MSLTGHKIAVLVESDYYEPEIPYYKNRFAEEGAEVHLMSRLWGQPKITFQSHEYRLPLPCDESFEGISDDELRTFSAVIVPGGIVADRLRYTENVDELAPATRFAQRAFAEPDILKGIICHGLWLLSTVPELVKGRNVTCHNNLVGDAHNMGAVYVDDDVVVDGDLVTGRTGGHFAPFSRKIIDLLERRTRP